MAKRGAKPKKVKGEMVWIPDYLVPVVKKIKETDMIALKENFAKLNAGDRAITIDLINTGGIKLLSELFIYRDHLVIPTVTPDQSLFGFKVITVISGEEIEGLDNPEFTPQESLEAAIVTAKAMIDTFFSDREWDESIAKTTDTQWNTMADQARQDIADGDS
jgi:hypothetical protein